MKILDILTENYQTKDGRIIELKREEDVEKINPGFVIDKITAYIDGEEAGYIKIQNIPHEKFYKHFGTIFNWMTQIQGRRVLPFSKESEYYENLSNEERRKMLKDIVYRTFVPWGEETKYVTQFNDKEVLEKIREFEQKLLNSRTGKQYKKFKNYHKDKPFVDFIKVHEKFQRQRVAEALYLEAAKWLKERGMKLHASGLQTDQAQAAWDHLARTQQVKRTKNRKRRYLELSA